MKQADLLDYVLLPDHCCYVYKTKEKEDGTYYFIRKKDGDKKKIAVIYPVKLDANYTCGSVCNVCNLLEIEVPPYGQTMQGTIDSAKATAKTLPNPGEN